DFRPGKLPVLVSIPHAGTELPTEIAERMTESARRLPDTDWFVDRLYEQPVLRDASLIVALTSRYVIDLNRPPSDESLYPGQNTTGLCPLIQFDGTPLYRKGADPTAAEITGRIADYWQPYHEQIRAELTRLRNEHPRVLIFDAHSIASQVPRLFPGVLPDFNFGTNHGATCSASFQKAIDQFAAGELTGYSHVVNGRFVGGYITRTYGQPSSNIEGLQLELSQATHLDEATRTWDSAFAIRLQSVLSRLFANLLEELER
ncbi:MAG: N-formylglutamate deformylase, partial [Planctomycetota bacterium]